MVMEKTEGKYIYAIIKESEDQVPGLAGIYQQEVHFIPCKDIAAVVSSAPIINFDRLDKEKLTAYVACHEKVNEELLKKYDVVPMAFGIIAPSIQEVLWILERAYLQFKTALERVADKIEFAVGVSWDQKRLIEELAHTHPEIQRLKQELASTKGILGIASKLKLGKLVHQELEAKKQAYVASIHETLGRSFQEIMSNKLLDEEMIANFSLLVGKAQEQELDGIMQELGKKYEGRLRFKYIGPMPPYSFADLDLKLGNPEVIDEARRLLGLEEKVSLEEIQKAYYALAHQHHPDKFFGDLQKEGEFKKIAQAYRILKNYCSGCDEFMGQKKIQKYSFQREDVNNSLIWLGQKGN